jgi:hypothetical protein
MASITYYSTIASKIDNINIQDGNLIFCRDTRTIYLDARGERTPYNTFINLQTEEQRETLKNPLEGFYFIQKSKSIWNYSSLNGWELITEPPSSSILFYNNEKELPEIGQDKTLYIVENLILKWQNNQYIKLNSSFEWGEF